MKKVQKAAIKEVIGGLNFVLSESSGNSALNDGDYSVYYLLGCWIGHRVKKRAISESLEPTKKNPSNWMDGWVYAYGDPSDLVRKFLKKEKYK